MKKSVVLQALACALFFVSSAVFAQEAFPSEPAVSPETLPESSEESAPQPQPEAAVAPAVSEQPASPAPSSAHKSESAAVNTVSVSSSSASVAQETEDKPWIRYSSIGIGFPFINQEFEADDADMELEGNGFAFDYSAHHVEPESGFTVLTRIGFGYLSSDITADYGSYYDEDDEEWYDEEGELEDFSGFYTYFNLGFGKAFTLLDNHLAIIPTAGFGMKFDVLYAEVTEYEYYDEENVDYFGVDFKFDLFFNLMVAYMFSDNFGISASCDVSLNLIGFGGINELEAYAIDFGSFSFMPTVGVCFRF